MSLLTPVILGILQGLTEFLPVSSSGHLVLVQNLLPGFSQPGVFFDVFLHLGTLIAVLVFFRKELFRLPLKYYLFIGVATVPAALFGFLFKTQLEALFSNIKLVGIALLITGLINFLTDKIKKEENKLTYKNSLITGVAQAVAIIPGISRSGSTIFTAVAQGLEKKTAAKFSFLMSIPAVLGANILEIGTLKLSGINNYPFYLIGFIFSFLFGLLAISLVYKFLLQNKFKLFAFYCLIIGSVALVI